MDKKLHIGSRLDEILAADETLTEVEAVALMRVLEWQESVEVVRAATEISGDMEKALHWYRNEPLSAFGYKTPEQLLRDGRAEDLIRYIQSLGE